LFELIDLRRRECGPVALQLASFQPCAATSRLMMRMMMRMRMRMMLLMLMSLVGHGTTASTL